MACNRCKNPDYPRPGDFYPNCSKCDTCPDCRGTGINIGTAGFFGPKACENPVCKGRGWFRKQEKRDYDQAQARERERKEKGVR